MAEKQNQKSLIISGDVTMDWNIARTKISSRNDLSWNPEIRTITSCQIGGAALLADLISQVANQLDANRHHKFSIFQHQPPVELVAPTNPDFHHSFSIWARFPQDHPEAWRVSEFLGLDQISAARADDARRFSIPDEPENPDILFIDDAAIGFRDLREAWPACLSNPNARPWILLKMSQPVGQGQLWAY